MQVSILTSLRREIRSSLGRWLAILLIMLLGVGVYCGLTVMQQDMTASGQAYINNYHMYDLRLSSTVGFDQAELAQLAAAAGVSVAEGAYSVDLIDTNNGNLLRAHSITAQLNQLRLLEGRLPQNSSECLADAMFFHSQDIGRVLRVDENSAAADQLSATEFTIVGLVNSTYYMYYLRGNSSLGNGTVDAFIYLEPAAFSLDYYTELLIGLDGMDTASYGATYQQQAADAAAALAPLVQQLSAARGLTVAADTRAAIAAGEEEYATQAAALDTAQAEIDAALAEPQAQLDAAKAQLDTAQQQLADGAAQLEQGQAELEQLRADVESGAYQQQLADARRQLSSAKAQLDAAEQQYSAAKSELESKESEYTTQLAAYNEGLRQYNDIIIMFGQGVAPDEERRLKEAKSQLDAARQQLDAGWSQLSSSRATIDSKRASYNSSLNQLNNAPDGAGAITQAEQALADGTTELAAQQEKYDAGRADYDTAAQQLAEKRDELEAQLDAAAEQLLAGREQLDQAIASLPLLDAPQSFVQTRSDNDGYNYFHNDTQIVAGMAKVFPVFFFLVAILICSCTMNRMIQEQRTQIGVWRALGLSGHAISSKYVLYAGSAGLTGAVAGFFLGSWLLPTFIWKAYSFVYDFGSFPLIFDLREALLATIAALAASAGVGWASCRQALRATPAQLIQPTSPPAGKRIWLEHIGFIWRRFSFMRKVSLRNIFRYKKRLLMMVLGLAGCSALLVAGFGVKDSINSAAAHQFSEISTFDLTVALSPSCGEREHAALLDAAGEELAAAAFLYQTSGSISAGGVKQNVYLMVSDGAELAPLFRLEENGQPLAYPGAGEALLSIGAAKTLGLRTGDTVTLDAGDAGMLELTISGVFENYAHNYLFVSPATCEAAWGSSPAQNCCLLRLNAGADASQTAARLMSERGVLSALLTSDYQQRFEEALKTMDYVVLIFLVCAAALSVIVIYNLTNLNITERQREIATIRVLGFYQRETASYVLRENIVLTVAGALCGLYVGRWLNVFVIRQIWVAMMYFEPRVELLSYAAAFLLTMIFASAVSLIMRPRISRIPMAESLKSVE